MLRTSQSKTTQLSVQCSVKLPTTNHLTTGLPKQRLTLRCNTVDSMKGQMQKICRLMQGARRKCLVVLGNMKYIVWQELTKGLEYYRATEEVGVSLCSLCFFSARNRTTEIFKITNQSEHSIQGTWYKVTNQKTIFKPREIN